MFYNFDATRSAQARIEVNGLEAIRGVLRLLKIIMALGRYNDAQFNKSTLKYTFANGSYIEFFSVDQPDKLRGARRNILYVNECNNIDFESYYQLAIRTSGDIWLDYNPTSAFWVDKEILTQNDVDFITLTYLDNEALSDTIVQEIEAAKVKALTSTYWANWWQVYGLGQTGSLEGVNSYLVLGVSLDTFLVGRQYSFLPPAPQGFPDFVSCHFSACHLFKSDPAFVFLTLPEPFLHLAIADDELGEKIL